MHTISQVRKIVDTHFRKHLMSHHNAVAFRAIGTAFLLFAAAGAIVGWFFGHPFYGAVALAAVHAFFLARNGDVVDQKILDSTGSCQKKNTFRPSARLGPKF